MLLFLLFLSCGIIALVAFFVGKKSGGPDQKMGAVDHRNDKDDDHSVDHKQQQQQSFIVVPSAAAAVPSSSASFAVVATAMMDNNTAHIVQQTEEEKKKEEQCETNCSTKNDRKGSDDGIREEEKSKELFQLAKNGGAARMRAILDECNGEELKRVLAKRDANGDTLMAIAERNGKTEVVKLLLEENAKTEHLENDEKGLSSSWLHFFAMYGNLEACKFMVTKVGAEVNQRETKRGAVPLHFAVSNGHLDIVKFLVDECGAGIELADFDGDTPLAVALLNKEDAIARYLITKGARCDGTNKKGIFPLHVAAHHGNLEMCKLVVGKGAKVDGKTTEKDITPLHVATALGHLHIVEFLVDDCGADVECADSDGLTPLISAVGKDNARIVHYLRSKGATDKAWALTVNE